MPLSRFLLALVAATLLPLPGLSAQTRAITPHDLWAMKRLGSPDVSPDGKAVVFTVQEWSVEKNRSTTNLWIADLETGALRRLTRAQASDGAPRWSPDGTRIAFQSKRGDDEQAALYVIPVAGGEAEKVIELPYAVASPKWLPDGKGVVVATRVISELAGKWTDSDREATRKEAAKRRDSKMTAKVSEHRVYRFWDAWLTDDLAHRLLKVDLATRSVTDLTPGWDRLFAFDGSADFEISPDGRWVAFAANSTAAPFRDELNPDIYLAPTDGTGAPRNLTSDNPGADASPQWAPNGRSLVYTRTKNAIHNGEFRKLWRYDLASGTHAPLTEAHDVSWIDVRFSPDGRTIWLSAEDQGLVPVFRMNADGTGLTKAHAAGTSTDLSVAGPTVAFMNDTMSRPNELFVLEAGGAVRQVTRFNEEVLTQLDLGSVESYWFEGADGARVHGWLIFPPKYDPARSYPVLNLMHGGPHTMVRDSWSYRWNGHVFAAPGYVVTWINRHGSTGFGEQFAMSILNEWGRRPLEDMHKGLDFLLARHPNLDGGRMAAAGASYGGYMAAWVAGHSDRFKAIINHAGVNNSFAQYGTDVPHGFTQVMGGRPWDADSLPGFLQNSPAYHARNFKTPMLITAGMRDYRVPYGNSIELYGVLQSMGVPSRLVLFPDENHWILSPQNSIYWNWEFQSWLARYIGGQPTLERPDFGGE
jgi:dipeptidyl aminopeptidase/acylaminoacyl peptidase